MKITSSTKKFSIAVTNDKEIFCGKKRTSIFILKSYYIRCYVTTKHSLSRIKIASRARTHTRVLLSTRAKIFFCSMLKPHVPALQTRERTHAPENIRGKWRSLNNTGKASPGTSHATGICSYMSKTSVHISL